MGDYIPGKIFPLCSLFDDNWAGLERVSCMGDLFANRSER